MIMAKQSFDLSKLESLPSFQYSTYSGKSAYLPYKAEKAQAPPFLAVGNKQHQVRLNASTHGNSGLIQKATTEALENTRRLQEKLDGFLTEYTCYEYDHDPDSQTLLLSYGISAGAARQTLRQFRQKRVKLSLLIIKTLLPFSSEFLDIISGFKNLIVVEENQGGLLAEMLYGKQGNPHLHKVNKIGHMITPHEIGKEVEACL